MNVARSTMVTAAISAATALAATGITYASAATTPHNAPATTATTPLGGGSQYGDNEGKGNEGKGHEDRGEHHEEEGRIHINERSYSTHPGDCITVASGLGARSVNVRNDSDKTVEVFRGAVCDNGAPIATVGPHSSSFGIHTCHPHQIHIEDGVIASFRVVHHHHD